MTGVFARMAQLKRQYGIIDPPKEQEILLPVVFNEDNIDLTPLQNQVNYWNGRIKETRALMIGLEELYEQATLQLKEFPAYMNMIQNLQQLTTTLDVLNEQLADSKLSVDEDEDDEEASEYKPTEKELARIHKRLKRSLNKLLHPDKVKSGFNSELYAHACQLLENGSYDELELLLMEIATRNSKTASKFSRKQMDESLRNRIKALKAEFDLAQDRLRDKLNGKEGMICSAYQQSGKIAALHTALDIGRQIGYDLKNQIDAARERLNPKPNKAKSFAESRQRFGTMYRSPNQNFYDFGDDE